jgi:hypothetical protein
MKAVSIRSVSEGTQFVPLSKLQIVLCSGSNSCLQLFVDHLCTSKNATKQISVTIMLSALNFRFQFTSQSCYFINVMLEFLQKL